MYQIASLFFLQYIITLVKLLREMKPDYMLGLVRSVHLVVALVAVVVEVAAEVDVEVNRDFRT